LKDYDARQEEFNLNLRVDDLMARRLVTAQRHHTVDHVRQLMQRARIHAIPIVDSDGTPVGIVSSADLVAERSPTTPISRVMTTKLHAVPAYNDVHVAARIMRRNRVHHVLVTHEKKLVGMISSFDLLRLVEDHRFVAKNGPTASKDRKLAAAR
jgi:CBS domain-containing protein